MVAEDPHLRPRYYLHLIGSSDAALPQSRRIETGHTSWMSWFKPRSAIIQAGVRLRQAYFAKAILVSHGAVTPPQGAKWTKAKADQNKINEFMEQIYKKHLRALLELHERAGEKVIFVSQPVNSLIIKRENGSVFLTRPEYGEYATGMYAANLATEQVCRERPGQCYFVDLAEAAFDGADFYDLVHNTPKGARTIGAFLAKALAFVQPARSATAPAAR